MPQYAPTPRPRGDTPPSRWNAQARSARLAAVEPEVGFRFPRGSARDARTPGGLLLVALVFTLVGSGYGSIAARIGVPAENIIGVLANAELFAFSHPILMALAGALAGAVAANAFVICWRAEETEGGRTAHLLWGFWLTAFAVMLARGLSDAVAGYFFHAHALQSSQITAGFALDFLIVAIAFLIGIALYNGLQFSKYDHSACEGPFGAFADVHRRSGNLGFAFCAIATITGFFGLTLLF